MPEAPPATPHAHRMPKQSFAILLSQSHEFACRNPTLGSISNNGGVDHMNNCHFSPERTRQIEPDIGSARRKRALVHRNKNFPKTHEKSPFTVWKMLKQR